MNITRCAILLTLLITPLLIQAAASSTSSFALTDFEQDSITQEKIDRAVEKHRSIIEGKSKEELTRLLRDDRWTHRSEVIALVAAGGDANVRVFFAKSPLLFCFKDDFSMFKFLVDKGANLFVLDETSSILHEMTCTLYYINLNGLQNMLKVTKYAIERGSEVNLYNSSGHTPLTCLAIGSGDLVPTTTRAFVYTLLHAGARSDLRVCGKGFYRGGTAAQMMRYHADIPSHQDAEALIELTEKIEHWPLRSLQECIIRKVILDKRDNPEPSPLKELFSVLQDEKTSMHHNNKECFDRCLGELVDKYYHFMDPEDLYHYPWL